MNILVIRLKSMGDVVLTLPAVEVLRDNFPQASITYLTSRENAALPTGFPGVNHIIALDRAALRSGQPVKVLGHFFGLLRQLRTGKFDLVVDLQGYGETAWLTRLTGAPKRWGSVYGTGRQWAYTLGVARDNRLHHAERFLAILRAANLAVNAPRNEFQVPSEAKVAAAGFLSKQRIDPAQPILFIQSRTSTPAKDWPLEKFIAVAEHFKNRGWQVVFGGGPGDRAYLEVALADSFAISAGVPLTVTAGLLEASRLVMGGDTGVLHLAVALRKQVLMILAPNMVECSQPYQHPSWVATPGKGDTVQSLPVTEVLSACDRILQESGNAG